LDKIWIYVWKQRKLGEIVNRITRKNSKLISELPLTISAQQGLIDQNEFFDKRVASKDVSGYYLIKNGEFAYNKSTSNDAPWGAIKRLDRYENGVLSTLYIVFEIKDETLVNSDFLVAYYSTNLWYKGIHEIAAEGARNHGLLNIAPTDFFKTKLKLPADIEEQQEIGEYFKKIDSLITFHHRKSNLFNKTCRNAWEQRKLGDFGKATGGTSIESEFSEDGIYKVISIGSYSENSVYNDQGIRAIKSDKTSNRVLNRNDLTMILNDKTTSGNIIGRVLLIEESGIYVYNQRTERIEINLDEYDPVFLYEMLNAPNIREKIIKQAQGNTQIYVNWTAISLLEYMIPSKEEQVKIGEYLHSISNLITLHQQKCKQLQIIRKFMLQNIFL
jgi:restriction endonuclease S subunit